MNKSAIKTFAIWARNKLIADISYKAGLLGITDKEIKPPLPQSTNDAQFFDIGTQEPYQITGAAIAQRRQLADKINEKARQSDYATAYKVVIEEVAYTWFNRLIAVRFMEVNDYLPSRVRVLSSQFSVDSGTAKAEPDIVTKPFDIDLEFTAAEREYIIACKTDNKLDELFRMLFIKQCNALNVLLPELFERIGDYTELLLNISFTDKDGVVWHLVNDINEDDFKEAVEIIGWLYQYYNTEPKDETFALLKKNVKITKERIPAATQLFTPNWIVRYMVENSLGRLWLEGQPPPSADGTPFEREGGRDALKANWKYYLDEAEQTPEVQAKLEQIRAERRGLSPEDITFIDPCMGSGHILVYAFDVFMQIYENAGYSQRDAARLILEKNIHGLDIDKRAYQLAYFALFMKARQYNRRIFDDTVAPQVFYPASWSEGEEYGSLLKVDDLPKKPEPLEEATLFNMYYENDVHNWNFKRLLSQRYDVVVTNPPYMGNNNIGGKLAVYISSYFEAFKHDLYCAMIEKCRLLLKSYGYQGMITQQSFMFNSRYQKARHSFLLSVDIVSLLHLGANAFEEISGEVVQTCSFIFSKGHIPKYCSKFIDLQNAISEEKKRLLFLDESTQISKHYNRQADVFLSIQGYNYAYWLSEKTYYLLSCTPALSMVAETRHGLVCGDSSRFMRFWFEISDINFGIGVHPNDQIKRNSFKWFPYNKGGKMRRWYGNNEYVVNWTNDGREVRSYRDEKTGKLKTSNYNDDYNFRESISWTDLTTGLFSARYSSVGTLFDTSGPALFSYSDKLLYIIAYMNSKIMQQFIDIFCTGLHYSPGSVGNVPHIDVNNHLIQGYTQHCIDISKIDWDSFETSWDFKRHPLIHRGNIATTFTAWERECYDRFNTLRANEEELNRIFIDIYGLQEELTPEVDDKDVTVRRAVKEREIRSLISYAVGCMFGRYSLDVEGLAYAGGEWDVGKYGSFIPDRDNIIPITDEEYLPNDIVTRFVDFIRTVYGAETLEENLRFIAEALGGRGSTAREVIRGYFIKDFFKDHVKIYQKRPIYWLFDSGKANGFKALIYLHRYDQDTVGKLRIDYLHKLQRVYENEIGRMHETIEKSDDAREVSAATKRLEKLTKQLKEAKEYDAKIAHLALARIALDLDDGVKVNYEKLQTDGDGTKHEVLGRV